ncbi:uncharacterized protein CDAR_260071 [Caerostris darwini]|uniref:Uncharacterized protein n=1 Tax=Caerostris darwini TaxID=1538125 RepID=A0AAV4V9G0_9ARAC|nr:uncharacterized protein CDAR_260071 [Caerostris darwini]
MEEKGDTTATSSGRTDDGGSKWGSRNKRLVKKKMTLMHLLKVICSSQQTCIEWLKSKCLIPKVMFCPNCSHRMKFEAEESALDGFVWICKDCKVNPPQCSTRHGSWLEDKDLSLVDILLFTYLWCHGFNEARIRKETNLEPEIIRQWNQMYIEICEAIQKKDAMLEENSIDENVMKTNSQSSVSAWRKKNKLKDSFLEFLKEADSL